MIDFPRKLENAIRNSAFASHSELSKAINVNPRYVANLLKSSTARDESKPGPGLFTVIKICEALEITVDELIGIRNDSGFNFSDAISRYHNSAHRLEAFEDVIEKIDIFFPPAPDAKTLEIFSMGKKSLAARRLGIVDKSIYQAAINMYPDTEVRQKIINDYARTKDIGFLHTIESINVPVPNQPKLIKLDYQRLLMWTTNMSGEPFIISYSLEL